MLFSLGQGCENLGRAYKNCAKVFLFKAVPAVRRLKKLILCRFVNDVLQIGERKKNVFRRPPVERTHGEIVVLPLPHSELRGKIGK